MINGMPYLESFVIGVLITLGAVYALIGHDPFMACFFGPKDIKKEPSAKTTER